MRMHRSVVQLYSRVQSCQRRGTIRPTGLGAAVMVGASDVVGIAMLAGIVATLIVFIKYKIKENYKSKINITNK